MKELLKRYSWKSKHFVVGYPVLYETPCKIINHETNKTSPNCAFSLFFFRFSKSECSNYQQLYTREASNVSISQIIKWTLQLAVCATKTAMINSNFSASSPEVSCKNSVKLTSFVNYFLFLQQSSVLQKSFSLIFIGLIWEGIDACNHFQSSPVERQFRCH